MPVPGKMLLSNERSGGIISQECLIKINIQNKVKIPLAELLHKKINAEQKSRV
jgi:hypothetical protein